MKRRVIRKPSIVRKAFTLAFSSALLHVAVVSCRITDPTPPSGGGPQFVINSPLDDATIGGTMFFSVQPFEPSEVRNVVFRVGGTELGTDSTPVDGFNSCLALMQL